MSDPRDAASRFLRTELLERIAHELRGPAGVTLGALDELEHALSPVQVEQNRLLFAMARRGARRVLRTAERLTRTAQLEGPGAQLDRASCDLRGLVQQAVKDAEQIEGRSSVQVQLSVQEAPCVCDADGSWLLVAVAELIAQAIRVARRTVEVSLQTIDQAAVVRVADDRTVIMDAPSERFVPLQDRRDSALGWPLICDVARAHGAELKSEPLRDEGAKVAGLAISLSLPLAG